MTDLPTRRERIRLDHRSDEEALAARLVEGARLSEAERLRVAETAGQWIARLRRTSWRGGSVEAFLREYDLGSGEGVALMCLAEALLRIPDPETADALIREQLGQGAWGKHLGSSDSLLVNASTWALLLTGRLLAPGVGQQDVGTRIRNGLAKSGEPLIRRAVRRAMGLLAQAFVMGNSIEAALARARPAEKAGYRHSYDMLGESARTQADARRYYDAYAAAIQAIGREVQGRDVFAAPGLSVKLSALHPRYEVSQRHRVQAELLPLLAQLAVDARAQGMSFTLDAEEADRLELSLDLFQALAQDPRLAGWDGLGLAVQAYQKRALAVIAWLSALARQEGRRLMVRLVKGAYWDSEIKLCQERGLSDYPLFTRKQATDASYIACARRLLAEPEVFFPAFATHNALTAATVLEMAGANRDFEFQRLHGMGEGLYAQIVGQGWPCRIYAPVGGHEDLLAYLVRRLLENGANASFVNRLSDQATPLEQLLADPAEALAGCQPKRHPRIPPPPALYGAERQISRGLDMHDAATLADLTAAVAESRGRPRIAVPLTGNGPAEQGGGTAVCSPADRRDVLGRVLTASAIDVDKAMATAAAAHGRWSETPAERRAALLEKAADRLEAGMGGWIALIVREGGRTLADAMSEVREAVDFLRYYAVQARRLFAVPLTLPGPVGERNVLEWRGRGVFVCISPWNFPLAIFTGQVAAALAAGNTVVAKPAEQTPLIGYAAARLLHAAGIPQEALQLLPGDGLTGAALVADARCAGVAFTGSVAVARHIARALADKPGPIVPLIAETGGQNAMIVDSSALVEQVVRDALSSAFNSAGQRCSALRVLFVQAEIAERVIVMLKGAMQELAIGDPADPATDIGPLIEAEAAERLAEHVAYLDRVGRLIHRCELPPQCDHGSFFPPCAYEIDRLERLDEEVFGPVLHVIRWRRKELDAVLQAISATGYGLTLGIHSRIAGTVDYILRRVRVGNVYVNRNLIGAVVGVQPFGGAGLSGTGPKAGGPHYLQRFAVERVVSTDTTAAGGNAALMAGLDDYSPPGAVS